MARPALIVILIAVSGIHAALAQDDVSEMSQISKELERIEAAIESSAQSSRNDSWKMFAISAAIAVATVVGLLWYARNLKEQIKLSEKHLELARRDTSNRLRPNIAWTKYGNEDMYETRLGPNVTTQPMIKIINLGHGAALDVRWCCKAGIVSGGDNVDDSKVKYHIVGSLASNASSRVPVTLTTEEEKLTQKGQRLQFFATVRYKSAEGKEYKYFLRGSYTGWKLELYSDGEDPKSGKSRYGICG